MATDDYAPQPIAPGMDFVEPEPVENVLVKQDQRKAKAYFHPAWEGVQDLLEEKIEALSIGTTNANLVAEEYKIEDQVNKRTAAHLKDILQQVANAVTATERPKGGE